MPSNNDNQKAIVEDKAAAASQNRLGQQAALMLNCDKILDKLQNSEYADRRKVKYKYFTTIRDSENKSTTTDCFEITNLLTKNESIKSFFYKLPPHVMSVLQPTIKLYKIFYPTSQLVETAEKGTKSINGYDWRIPFDDVSVGSPGNPTSSEYVNETLQGVLNGAGRLGGAGIKSFSYSYKGVNPAEINTNIVANLELFMSSPDDLIRSINIRNDDPRFINAGVSGLPEGISFSYSDLVNQSSRIRVDAFTKIDKRLVVNEHYYRIKAVVGYVTPPQNYLNNLNLTQQQIEDLKKAINISKVILLLTPYSHSFDFNENGNISLKIEYHAMIDKVLASQDADVLKANITEYVAYKQAKKTLEDAKDNKLKQLNKIKCNQKDTTNREKEINQAEENNKKTIQDAQNNLRIANLKLYSALNKKILNLETGPVSANKKDSHGKEYAGVYVASMHPSAVGVTSLIDNAAAETITMATGGFLSSVLSFFSSGGERLEKADTIRIKKISDSRKIYKIELLKGESKRELANKLVDKPSQEIIKDIENKKAADEYQKKSDSENEELNPQSNNTVNVKFVFLGDVLDAALECMKYVSPASAVPRIVLGNINIEIPHVYIEGDDEETKSWTITTTINLADVPISLELLNAFLIDKLVRQNKSSYPVTLFIKDVISELVIACISPKYFGTSAKLNSAIRISNLLLSVPLDNNKRDVLMQKTAQEFINANQYSSYPDPIDLSNLKQEYRDGIKKFFDTDIESLLANDVASYYFIYCSTKFNEKGNVGDEDEDAKKGIFHFRMGTDSGIVKKITFSKTDSPFYREAVAAQEGKDNVSLIKQVYDAKIEMFGNNIYRPGDIIYVEPYVSYVSRTRQQAYSTKGATGQQETKTISILVDMQDYVGIGGYYLVTEVETNINENAFNTNLTALFKAHKYIEHDDPNKDCK